MLELAAQVVSVLSILQGLYSELMREEKESAVCLLLSHCRSAGRSLAGRSWSWSARGVAAKPRRLEPRFIKVMKFYRNHCF